MFYCKMHCLFYVNDERAWRQIPLHEDDNIVLCWTPQSLLVHAVLFPALSKIRTRPIKNPQPRQLYRCHDPRGQYCLIFAGHHCLGTDSSDPEHALEENPLSSLFIEPGSTSRHSLLRQYIFRWRAFCFPSSCPACTRVLIPLGAEREEGGRAWGNAVGGWEGG